MARGSIRNAFWKKITGAFSKKPETTPAPTFVQDQVRPERKRRSTKCRQHMSFSARVWTERQILAKKAGIDRWNSRDAGERERCRETCIARARGFR